MNKYRIYYHMSSWIEVFADSVEKAKEQFENMTENQIDELDTGGYVADDVEEV